MWKVALTLLVLGSLVQLVHDTDITITNVPRITKRQSLVPFMNPPIPTSISHYLGGNQQLDKCERDEVLVLEYCHRVLTQGPCKVDEQVLLDPNTYQGYCAPRLCPPDRIFVFSDQQCHDPMNIALCPPGRQLYITAYGTPVCQCPEGTYESDDDLDDDVCDPLLGRTLSCPPNQVLWFRDFSMPPECLPDPCGGENLNRGPNDLPFVPSAADGRCYQLGQSSGVCPAQTWYSLALEVLKGMCTSLEDAGYQIFDEETLATLTRMYGPPIARESTTPLPTPPFQPTSALSPQSPQRPVSPQSPTFQSPQSPFSPPSPPSSSLQPQGPAISGFSQNRQDFPPGQPGVSTTGQGFRGQPGVSSTGQGFRGQPGVSSTGQGFRGQPGVSSTGQGFRGQPGVSSIGQGFRGQPGVSSTSQGFRGQPGVSSTGQGFRGQPGASSTGQGFRGQPGVSSTGQVGVSSTGQSFSGQSGTSSLGPSGVFNTGQTFTGQSGTSSLGHSGGTTGQIFSGQSGTSSSGQLGGFTTGQTFSVQSGASSSGQPGGFTTGQTFSGQSGTSSSGQSVGFTTGQTFHSQSGTSSRGQTFSGQSSTSSNGQTGAFTTTQTFPGQSVTSSPSQSGVSRTGQGFSGQSGASTTDQRFSGQSGVSATGQRFSGQSGVSTTGQSFSSQVTVGQRRPGGVSSVNPTNRPHMSQASTLLSPRIPHVQHSAMGFPAGGYSPYGFNQGGYFYSTEMSLEMDGGPDMMIMMRPNLGLAKSFHSRAHSHSQTPAGSHPGADVVVRQGHLLTKVTGLADVGQAGPHDLTYLHKPRNHQLHGFYNGVRSIMSGVLNGGQSHHRRRRSRRSPLPHATPANVFETRLVGCRAGAVRDINAKCKNTILPPRAPVKRSTRVVPPVPPRPGCPTGQVYNLKRMCSPRDSAIDSINAFNLG